MSDHDDDPALERVEAMLLSLREQLDQLTERLERAHDAQALQAARVEGTLFRLEAELVELRFEAKGALLDDAPWPPPRAERRA